MTAKAYVDEVERVLSALADSAKAGKMAAYLKHQFTFLGIPTPIRREALKSLLGLPLNEAQIFEIAELLWLKPEREYRYVAIDLLGRKYRQLSLECVERIVNLAQRESWWETVDGLSGVIGDIVAMHKKSNHLAHEFMDGYLYHPNLWVQRIAMTYQLGARLETDEARLFRYAITLSKEKDFFIRKAIGWALRDYARWNPAAVRDFISSNQQHFSGLTIREATKHIAMQP